MKSEMKSDDVLEMEFREGFVVRGSEDRVAALIRLLSGGVESVKPVPVEDVPVVRSRAVLAVRERAVQEVVPVKRRKRRDRFEHGGLKWTAEDARVLAEGLANGRRIKAIARELKRSVWACYTYKHKFLRPFARRYRSKSEKVVVSS